MSDADQKSASWRLTDLLLGGTLDALIRERRAAGVSWRLIEREIDRTTGGKAGVSAQTIRTWYPDDLTVDVPSTDRDASAAAS